MRNKKVPGSVVTRKFKTGNYLYYRSKATDQKWIASGLIDSAANRKRCWEILEDLYLKSIMPKTNEPEEIYYSVQEMYEEYERYCKEVKELDPRTIKHNRTGFNHIIKDIYFIEEGTRHRYKFKYRLEEDLEHFATKSSLGANSINIYIRSFAAFLNWLVKEGVIKNINYQQYFKRIEKKEPVAYNEKEIQDLINYFIDKKNLRVANWLMFMMETGTRRTESLRLKWEHVNFEDAYIKMPKKKNSKNYDKFPMTDFLKGLLAQLKVESERRPTNRELIFGWKETNASRLNKTVSDALTDLGIKRESKTFHPIRKHFITKLIESGNILYIKSLARHSDIKTTEDHYWMKNLDKMRDVLLGSSSAK